MPAWALLEPPWGHLGPSWSPLGANLGPLGAPLGPSWALLEPSWGHLRPSWGRLGPSWSLRSAKTRNPENHRKTIGFSTFLPSGVPSGSVLGVSGTVFGASCGIREASGAIVARLGGVLQVVLALWSRLGGRMGPFGADLEPEGGAIFIRGWRDASLRKGGSALENRNKSTRQHSGILTRPYRAGTVADFQQIFSRKYIIYPSTRPPRPRFRPDVGFRPDFGRFGLQRALAAPGGVPKDAPRRAVRSGAGDTQIRLLWPEFRPKTYSNLSAREARAWF